MTRRIVYFNQLASSLAQIEDQKRKMIELAKANQAILGTNLLVDGFDCIPTTPGSLNVNLSPITLFAYVVTDQTPYGELPTQISADANEILKIAYDNDPSIADITPPATIGFSRNDLIQVAFQEVDDDNQPLSFWNGTNSSGAPKQPVIQDKNTLRSTRVVIEVKQGVAAATGTQTTPTPDVGYTGLWVITTDEGQTEITSNDIAEYPNDPEVFIKEKLQDKISKATADTLYLPINTDLSYYNRLINGRFGVWQRGFSFTFNTANGHTGFTADRWFWTQTDGETTISIQTLPLLDEGNGYGFRINRTTAAGLIPELGQAIEDVRTFAGRSLSFTFASILNSGSPVTVTAVLRQYFGTGGSPSTPVVTQIGQVTLTNTGTREIHQFVVDIPDIAGKTIGTDNNSCAQLIFEITDKIFDLTLVYSSAVESNVVHDFQSDTLELERCYRYFQKSYSTGTTPGTITQAGANHYISPISNAFCVGLQSKFPTVMRTTPTVQWYSPNTGTIGYVWNFPDNVDIQVQSNVGVSLGNKDTGYPELVVQAPADKDILAHWTAEAELPTQASS